MVVKEKLENELYSFQKLWKGGYYEGDPLDPMSKSGYGIMGYMSLLHVVYLSCIKPYINENTVVLEIGPGRGAWTKSFLKAKEIWCLDALSAEHNLFWKYLQYPVNVKYFQVSDFTCSMLPENQFDYMFSFGCLCHVSFDGITEYMKNIYPKLKKNAHGFIMVADYDKYNKALDNIANVSIARAFSFQRYIFLRWVWKLFWNSVYKHRYSGKYLNKNENNEPIPGRWYHAGTERTCIMLRQQGYEIIESDMEILYRDPVIHFIKP